MTNYKHAFTLIEVILYLAIASTMILAIAGFLGVTLQARSRYLAISEVGQQGTFIMSVLRQDLSTAAYDPSMFAVSNGVLSETISGETYNLNSPAVSVSNLQFTSLSGNITRVNFTLSQSNYQANFYDSFFVNP